MTGQSGNRCQLTVDRRTSQCDRKRFITNRADINAASRNSEAVRPIRQWAWDEVAWCSTFNCLRTSQTRDSAGFRRNTLICKLIWFFERLTWNPADVLRQPNVLHQAASCFSCYDIRDIAIHVYLCNVLLISLLKIRRQPTTGFTFFGAHQRGVVP
ncbi:hypothetical protein T265_03658 [Opisthorchis viverrini]|uniref:Uncharacterized protein n=1 Tax=Opisthorchis viverrini TaxID=6198 RepID=A0A074ZRN4_OPIVI|nr:hypothetical protein T265_03658 [Opisthorchis viverrini]KER29746.1 hypothetical protein T265_03658 [Opisthorchis viverrini]